MPDLLSLTGSDAGVNKVSVISNITISFINKQYHNEISKRG